MGDDVRPQDIKDLKEEDKNIHLRISRNADQNREDFQILHTKVEKVGEGVNKMAKPMGAMATQVATNEKDITRIEDVVSKKVDYETTFKSLESDVKTLRKMIWGAAIGLLIELIVIVIT